MPRIWVDVVTGTWGDANDLRLVFASEESVADLDNMSDSEIIVWATRKGAPVV